MTEGPATRNGEAEPTGTVSAGGIHLTPLAVTTAEGVAKSGQDTFGASFGGDTSGFGGLVRRVEAQPSTPRGYEELGP